MKTRGFGLSTPRFVPKRSATACTMTNRLKWLTAMSSSMPSPDLFRNYIGAIERHEIVCPRIDAFYTEHKYCGADNLFGSEHPPDTVVAMALAYHAFKAGRQPGDYGVTI